MAKLRVRVHNVDDDTLYTHKTIKLGHKSIETPTKAIPIGKTTRKDTITEKARGFNEIYAEVDYEGLEEARNQPKSNLKKNLRGKINKTNNGEFILTFINYKSTRPMGRKNIEYLHDLIYSTSDFLTIPLMPDLLSAIKDEKRGLSSSHFETYIGNVKQFIKVARQLNGKPIMGVIPTLPRAFVDKIINIYIDERVQAFCFNFNGRTVTAESQLTDMVTPVMRNVAVQNMEEDVILYSLNAHRGRKDQDINATPARDFMTFGFGLDVLGEKHIAGNLPPSLLKKMSDSEPTFRLFENDHYIYSSYEYGNDLRSHLPSDTGLDPRRILHNPNKNYQLSALLNSEQQAMEAIDLRPAIDEYRILDHIGPKMGIQPENLQDMKSARQSFSGNKSQTSLSDLDELDDMLG